MLDSFLTFINQQKLDLSAKSTLLTVSGGVDSIVLAHLFYRAGFSAGIAHCNFRLRGEESEGDEVFVAQLARQYGFPFHVQRFETKKEALDRGISTQMAARALRYTWFEEVRQSLQYDFVATAHHLNDAFETVLLNLTRGTGIAGLHGIAVKNQNLIRPLLFASREEIMEYAAEQQLTFREDSSNLSSHYKRNLIRQEVVPVLKKMNPSLEHTFKTTTKRLSAAEALLQDLLQPWKKEAVKDSQGIIHISIKSLLESSEPVYRLWFILEAFGFTYRQAEEIFLSAEGLSGKWFESATHVVLKDRDLFLVSERTQKSQTGVWVIDQTSGKFKLGALSLAISNHFKNKEFEVNRGGDTACFDQDRLLFPLTVRSWMPGDTFNPFGMGGKSKKVSDLLIDLKLNMFEKQNVKVLLNGIGDILWVIGLRTDDRYKVQESTQQVLVIQLEEQNSGLVEDQHP
jgi:tRNA(Ile)-lysidine synthase